MNHFEDDAAYNYVDHLDGIREIGRLVRSENRKQRHRFYVRTLGAIIGAFLVIYLFGCCNYYDGFGWQPCAGYVHDNHPK